MSSLAVKYRPKDFTEVVAQRSTVQILQRQVLYKEYRNSYIFCGQSGSGKTSVARVFANAINNGEGTPIEIDAASNNGVDNIRIVIDEAKTRALDCEYKIFIIDEAHQLTTQSWNALLKIIEEPPKYTIFIFCTTEEQKIPATIQNRCQKFTFTKIPVSAIILRLKLICERENLTFTEDALDYIAKMSNGGLRDAICNLEKVANINGNITTANAVDALGGFYYTDFIGLINYFIDGKEADVIRLVEAQYENGNDLTLFARRFFVFILDVTKYLLLKDLAVTQIPNYLEDEIKSIISIDGANKYYEYLLDSTLRLKQLLKNDDNVLATVEVAFLKMCRCEK